ncbi:MAG: orotidine-5'-phosphate decarboxylase [Candidatus Jorgensenbacteria bacterium]
MNTTNRIFVALDGLGKTAACELVREISNSVHETTERSVGAFKIHDLWDQEGPDIVRLLRDAGANYVFIDLKLHDVPNTVGLRAKAVAASGANIVTVHASGGIEMMQAAVANNIRVVGITILTSLTEEDTHLLCGQPTKAAVLERARWAKLAGVYGVVCSAHEVSVLAKRPELKGLKLIVPGIRLKGKSAVDDNQKRVDSPLAAFEAGADHIVVGSEITGSPDPIATLEQIIEQIAPLETKE